MRERGFSIGGRLRWVCRLYSRKGGPNLGGIERYPSLVSILCSLAKLLVYSGSDRSYGGECSFFGERG